MANFTALYSSKYFLLKVLIRPPLVENRTFLLLAGPGIYPQIYHRIYVLQYVFVKGSNKEQRRAEIISNFTKEETSSHLL